MAGYYSPAPTPPPPAEGWLPYPWVTQFDPQYQSTYYANAETGETSWTRPDPNVVYSQPPPPEVVAAVESSNRGGGMYDSAPASSSSNTRSGGEAASFYGSAGSSTPGPSAYSSQQDPAQQQQQYDANGQPINGDGERGLGKVIIGGGLAYFAYKKYKEYQKGKLNQQQFKPPSSYQGPPPNSYNQQPHNSYGNQGYGGQPQYPQGQFGAGHKRDDVGINNNNYNAQPPMPAWDQKPAAPQPYGGAPPNAYSDPSMQYQQPYGQTSSPYPQQPQASYDPAPIPFNGGGAAQQPCGGQPPSYDTYANQYGGNTNQGSSGFGAPTKSAWGDPRFS